MVNYLSFHNSSSFALTYLFNVNGKLQTHHPLFQTSYSERERERERRRRRHRPNDQWQCSLSDAVERKFVRHVIEHNLVWH
jgi:Ca2+/H+ antiporter